MFDVIGDINWIGVVLATLACTVLGGVWFAALFAKQYARSLGRDPNVKPEMTPLSYAGPLICTLLTVIASAVLLQTLDVESMTDAFIFGTIVGVGYLFATMTNVAINPNFPRPLAYAAVNGPYFVLNSLIISSILVALD
jgi:ABC-type enterobactin transport system permease subunit